MPELVFSEEIGKYFDDLAAKNEVCYEVARKARRVGRDPKTEVEAGVLAEECGSMVTEFFKKKR